MEWLLHWKVNAKQAELLERNTETDFKTPSTHTADHVGLLLRLQAQGSATSYNQERKQIFLVGGQRKTNAQSVKGVSIKNAIQPCLDQQCCFAN